MKAHVSNILLDEVWRVLDGIVPGGEGYSLAESGMVTAASTDGAVVRVLLGIPTILCETGNGQSLLSEIEESIGGVSLLSDVEMHVKPSRPAWTAADPHYGTAWAGGGAEARSLPVHGACVQYAATSLSLQGWVFEEERRRMSAALEDGAVHADKVRVIIHARIRSEPYPLDAA